MRSLAVFALAASTAVSCYSTRFSHGGGEIDVDTTARREVAPADVAVPAGYRIEVVATGLTFPTGVAFDGDGRPCVVESGYAYGEVFTTPRLLRVEQDGKLAPIASGTDNGPWTGVDWKDGAFYVAEGGARRGGRLLRIGSDGAIETLVEDLPSRGDHHVNGPRIGPDGAVYFGIGVATNSGVVGEDNVGFGWLARAPGFHDIPGADIRLAGQNFETSGSGGTRKTGAFVPFGTETTEGQVIRGQTLCTGSVLRIPASGGEPELVAWGFRNPFGFAFAPDGALYATDNGFDERGSRPVWGAADVLWRVEEGRWYGWPDFAEGRPVTREEFEPPGEDAPRFLLLEHPGKPPKPVARFACHASADGLDFAPERFGHAGQAFVALFGDQVPGVGKLLAPVGFKVVRVDLETGAVEDFATNRADRGGPASLVGGAGLERPVAVRFDPSGEALYVVDFGVLAMDGPKSVPREGTGVLWRIVRESENRS